MFLMIIILLFETADSRAPNLKENRFLAFLWNLMPCFYLFFHSLNYLWALVSDIQKSFTILMPKQHDKNKVIEMIIMILIIMIPLTDMLI